MKKKLQLTNSFGIKALTIFVLCAFINSQYVDAQVRLASSEPVKLDKEICIYKPDPNPVRSFIPVQSAVKARMDSNTSDSRTIITGSCATFDVTYTGFTAAAESAFTYAVQIWANTIVSTETIKIDANFGPLDPGVLGGAGPALYYLLTGPGIPADTLFPSALTDALTGGDADPSGSDIDASFSSTASFYFGTDGMTPGGQYDFVSVVLHEIGHGLGIAGFGREQLDMDDNPTGLGELRLSGQYVSIWDQYIENGSDTSILTFTDPSVALLGQFTGGDLFSNGPETTSQNGSVNPEMYAPNPFESGSSYSHWDEASYPAGHPNSLMTPQIGMGEAIHDPGVVTLGFMFDMFWSICGNLLSTPEVAANELFNYYPNPVKTNISLIAQNIIDDITIFNMLGQQIIQSKPNDLESTIDLTELQDGAYFMQVTIGNTTKTVKVLKN